jgi:mRNA interferase HigB
MRLLSRSTLRQFWEEHPDAEQPLRDWLRYVESGDWTCPQDIRDLYANASFVGNERVVFNISGNKYRLIAIVRYPFHIVYIRFLGTHAEYDRIDAKTV